MEQEESFYEDRFFESGAETCAVAQLTEAAGVRR